MQDNCYIVCIEWMYEITVFLLYACYTYQYILVPKKLRVWNRYARIYYCGMITQYITRSYGCRLNVIGKGLKFLFLFSHRKRNRNETLYKTFVPDSNTFYVPSPLSGCQGTAVLLVNVQYTCQIPHWLSMLCLRGKNKCKSSPYLNFTGVLVCIHGVCFHGIAIYADVPLSYLVKRAS